MVEKVMSYNNTKISNYYTIFPGHLNRHNTLFGGQILYWLDDATGLVIRRYADIPFVTATIDNYQFLDAVYGNEALLIETYISRVGGRSLEVFAEVSAFNHENRETRLVGLCFSTFVVRKDVELTESLPQLEYVDEVAKFVNESYEKRKNNEILMRDFTKLYRNYYNKKNINNH